MSEVPVSRPRGPGWQLRSWLAAWLAAVLALAPLAQPASPVAAAAPAGAPDALASRDGTRDASLPTAGSRPAEPVGRGILSPSLLAEAAFTPPPAKPPLLRTLVAAEPWVAARATGPMEDVARDVFHRSSVGSARNPTGPPA
jgi:hypothetical protein